MIASAQIRAGRSLLRWSAADLSVASGVGTATLQRMEVMDGMPLGQVRTLLAIKEALEAAGVEFVGTSRSPWRASEDRSQNSGNQEISRKS